MRTVQKTLKTGKGASQKVEPFVYEVPESVDEMLQTYPKDYILTCFCYGHDLKLRTKKKSGNKEQVRLNTMAWMMRDPATWNADLAKHMKLGKKELDKFLDEAFATADEDQQAEILELEG